MHANRKCHHHHHRDHHRHQHHMKNKSLMTQGVGNSQSAFSKSGAGNKGGGYLKEQTIQKAPHTHPLSWHAVIIDDKG